MVQNAAAVTLATLARQVHGDDPAFQTHAAVYARLLDLHSLDATPSMLQVEVPRTGPLPTFVLESGAGTPVLFLHGTPATSLVWVPLLAALPGARALAIDRPGHGLSGGMDYATVPDVRAWTMGYLDALLDSLGLVQVVLAGNSFGGLSALWYALDRPERVSAILQLGAPPGMLNGRTPAIFGLLSVPWVARMVARMDPPSVRSTRRVFRMMGGPPDGLDDVFLEAYTTSQQLPTVEGGIAHLVQAAVRFPGRFGQRHLWLDADALGRVGQPTLFVWGQKDFLGRPDVGRRVAAAMPDAQLVECGVGHLPWLQDPIGVAEAVTTFLDRP